MTTTLTMVGEVLPELVKGPTTLRSDLAQFVWTKREPSRGRFVIENWIYFIQGDDGGPVKIGRTKNSPWRRPSDLQIAYPFGRLRLVGLVRGYPHDELRHHARFRANRLIGEWFSLSPALATFINELPREGI